MKSTLYLVSCIFCCLILAPGSSSSSSPSSLAGDPNNLVAAMISENLIVKEGSIANVDIIGLCCDPQKKMPMCYGNNPGAPYIVAYVPEGYGQTTINSPLNYYSFPPSPSSVGGDNRSRSYRFGPNEAVVIVGKTPPSKSTYYSFDTYVSLRCVTGNCFAGATPDFLNDYKRRFASMVDALSNHTIWTAGTPGGVAGDSFGKDTMIIITSDRSTERRIREAARKAAYSELIINTIILPAEIARLGLDYGKDEIAMLFRLAVWDDTYINNPPLRVFRVASTASVLDPFPTPALTPRGGKSVSEKVRFGTAVSALRSAILQQYGGYTATEYKTDIWVQEGRESLALDTNRVFNGYDVLGDNHDAFYLRIPDLAGGKPADKGHTFSLDNSQDDFIIVYGVNHTKAGFTTYSSISTYRHAMLNGSESKWIEPDGTSAVLYLKNSPYANQARYLYVMRVARSCADTNGNGELCMELPECVGCPANCNPECKTTGADDLFLSVRGYLEPATGVGPSYDEIIWDSAIHFKK
jgi:hypothetical protein